jgi:L-lactate dehydrogenase
MKIGIVGAGQVGAACVYATIMRGFAREIVLVNKTRDKAKGVVADMRYGALLSPETALREGDYAELKGADVVMVTVGVNEKTGGATDRTDPKGRLRLLDKNADIFRDVIPRVTRGAGRQALILTVSDPPDPLNDLARRLAPHNPVLSTGTYLDSLRFRVHLAAHLGVSPKSVEAQVLGEHGTSQVFIWSGARLAGVPIAAALRQRRIKPAGFRAKIEKEVRYANITIIEGIGASQYGIGMVSARIAEMVAKDERLVIPIGSYNKDYGVTLSLPTVVGKGGARKILAPQLAPEERAGLRRSAATLRAAVKRMGRA